MVIHQFNRIIRNKWIWGAFAIAISAFFAFDFLLAGGDARENRASVGELNGEEVPASRFSRFAEDARGFDLGRFDRGDGVFVGLGDHFRGVFLGADDVLERAPIDGGFFPSAAPEESHKLSSCNRDIGRKC